MSFEHPNADARRKRREAFGETFVIRRCIAGMAITMNCIATGCGGSNVTAPRTGYDLGRVYQGEEVPESWSNGRKIRQTKEQETSGHFSESLVFELTIPRAAKRSLILGLEKAVVAEAERQQLRFEVRPETNSKGAKSFTVACDNDHWRCAVSGLIKEKRRLPRGFVCVLVELSYRESKL